MSPLFDIAHSGANFSWTASLQARRGYGIRQSAFGNRIQRPLPTALLPNARSEPEGSRSDYSSVFRNSSYAASSISPASAPASAILISHEPAISSKGELNEVR